MCLNVSLCRPSLQVRFGVHLHTRAQTVMVNVSKMATMQVSDVSFACLRGHNFKTNRIMVLFTDLGEGIVAFAGNFLLGL